MTLVVSINRDRMHSITWIVGRRERVIRRREKLRVMNVWRLLLTLGTLS
jgi:hypothetical protein